MKTVITSLFWLGLCLSPLSGAMAADTPQRLQLAESSDYDVGGSNSTWTGGGLAPTPKCEKVCSSDYHTCMADCFRGAVETMGGCAAACSINYCETICE